MHLVSLRLEQEDYFYIETNLLEGTPVVMYRLESWTIKKTEC